MRQFKRWGTLVLLLTLISVMGCQKWSANRVIKQANKSKAAAEEVQAHVYVSETMNSGDTALNRAVDASTNKQWKEAIDQARIANEQFEKAKVDVDAARQVIAKKQESVRTLITGAETILAKARERGVDALDATAAEAAVTAISDAKTRVDAQIARVDLQRPQDYDALVNEVVQPAADKAQAAYDLTLADEARQRHNLFNPLNEELTQILSNPSFRPASADALDPKISAYYDFYNQNKFEAAMGQLDLIQQEFNTVLDDARKLRAEATLRQANEKSVSLDTTLNASQAVPSIFDKAAAALTEADAAVAAGDFATVYAKAQEALTALDQVEPEMRRKAAQYVSEGREMIKQGEEVEVLKYQADRFNGGIAALDEADQLLAAEDLRNGFARAEQGYNDVSGAILETKRLKADAALQRARTVLSHVENEGAARYAPEPYGKARSSMDKALSAYNNKLYIEVLPLADTAETDANAVVVGLRERAEQEIAAAKIALASAEQAQSEKYQPQQIQRVRGNIAEGESALGQEGFLKSIESSLSAQQTARAAEDETYRQRTQETVQLAITEQRLGSDSGAKEHTPDTYLNGLEALRVANDLSAGRRFKEALAAAEESLDSFRKARFRKIDDANAAVESARAALAEQYTPSDIQTAMSRLADARIAMNEARYAQSNQLADQARKEAEDAENETWRLRGQEQIAANQATIARLSENLANEKTRDIFVKAAGLQGEAGAIFQTAKYKAAYEKSVEARDTLNDTEKNLGQAAATAIAELEATANGIIALGGGDFTAAQVAVVISEANAAKAALDEAQYRTAFDHVKAGSDLARTVDRTVKDNILLQGVAKAHIDVASAEANGIAGFVPAIITDIKTRINTLDAQKTVMTYDAAKMELDSLQAQIRDLENQARQANAAGLQEAQRLLDEARRAQALNYIRDKYFDATDKYKKAEAYRDLMEPPIQGYFNDMYALFRDAILSASAVHTDTNRIREEKAYKDLIFYNQSSYMNDMASLLNRFASVTDFTPEFFRASKSSADVDIYKQLQKKITAAELLKRAQYLYDSVSNYNAPPTLSGLHSKVVQTFKELTISADYFVKFGEYGRYETQLRQQFIEEAFKHLEKVKILNQQIEEELLAQEREAAEGPVKAKNWFQRFWQDIADAWRGPERYRHVNMPRS